MAQKNTLKISCFLNIISGKDHRKNSPESLWNSPQNPHKGQEEAFITTISPRSPH